MMDEKKPKRPHTDEEDVKNDGRKRFKTGTCDEKRNEYAPNTTHVPNRLEMCRDLLWKESITQLGPILVEICPVWKDLVPIFCAYHADVTSEESFIWLRKKMPQEENLEMIQQLSRVNGMPQAVIEMAFEHCHYLSFSPVKLKNTRVLQDKNLQFNLSIQIPKERKERDPEWDWCYWFQKFNVEMVIDSKRLGVRMNGDIYEGPDDYDDLVDCEFIEVFELEFELDSRNRWFPAGIDLDQKYGEILIECGERIQQNTLNDAAFRTLFQNPAHSRCQTVVFVYTCFLLKYMYHLQQLPMANCSFCDQVCVLSIQTITLKQIEYTKQCKNVKCTNFPFDIIQPFVHSFFRA